MPWQKKGKEKMLNKKLFNQSAKCRQIVDGGTIFLMQGCREI